MKAKKLTQVPLRNLPFTGRRVTRAVLVRSVTAGMRHLREWHLAITAAGDNGSINVWYGNDNLYHCEVYRFGATVSSSKWRYMATVDAWLREWLPQIK